MNDPENLTQNLVNLRHLNSKFHRKLKELKVLKSSLDEAFHQGEVTKEDCDNLKELLHNLSALKNEYESVTDDFNCNLGSQAPQEAANADKDLEEALSVYYNVHLKATRLLRRIRKHIDSPHGSGNRIIHNGSRAEGEELEDKDAGDEEEGGEMEEKRSRNSEEHMRKGDNDQSEEEKEDQEEETVSLKCSVVKGLLITVVFYFGLGFVIKTVLDSRNESYSTDITPIVANITQDNKTCGSENFMMRDSVCDDPSNIAICLYDGGDCCLENKDKTLCKNCTCILDVDKDELKKQFGQLKIKPLKQSSLESIGGIVEVEEVVSDEVCAVLCLNHDKADVLNYWQYLEGEMVCKCGWIEATSCPEKMTITNWSFSQTRPLSDTMSQSDAFVQLKKTVPCDCLAKKFLIKSEESILAKVDYPDPPSAKSLWHCQQMCNSYQDCDWFSWNMQITGSNAADEGDCRLMMELPQNTADLQAYIVADYSWVSAPKKCGQMAKHFKWHSFGVAGYQFLCPNHRLAVEGTTSESSHNGELLIYLNGLPESSIAVYKFEQGIFVECGHSLIPPEKPLILATGGILRVPQSLDDESAVVAVVCGGEFVDDDSNNNKPNDRCMILHDNDLTDLSNQVLSSDGFLNAPRVGAVSLTIDNGNTLWLTGGIDSLTSEFVVISGKASASDSLGYSINAVGPSLPELGKPSGFQCFTKIGPEVVMIMGGKSSALEDLPSWSMNMSTMIWKQQPHLTVPRYKHACGVLRFRDGSGNNVAKLAIVAGGTNEAKQILKSVETLLVTEDDHQFASQWMFGPDMPIGYKDVASATTSDQKEFFIIGGTNTNSNSDSVFKFQCWNVNLQECSWTKLDIELQNPGTMGLALIMPTILMVPRQYSDSQDCATDVEEHESVLLLTTGWNGQHAVGDTESFNIGNGQSNMSMCQPQSNQTQSMYAFNKATGGLLRGLNQGVNEENIAFTNIPLVCGGITHNGEANDKCYRLETNQFPTVVGRMSRARLGAATTVLFNGTTLWVTGGHSLSNIATNTSEWLSLSAAASLDGSLEKMSEGIKLPMPMASHCLEMINDNTAVIYGGSEAPDAAWTISLNAATSFYFSLKNDSQWVRLGQLLIIGRYEHICGVIQTDISNNTSGSKKYVIVAAGGRTTSDHITNHVELLQVVEAENDSSALTFGNYWEAGPTLPVSLAGAASATTHDQSAIFVAGGMMFSVSNDILLSDSVFSFFCRTSGDNCQWREFGKKQLTFGRSDAIAMIIPPVLQNASWTFSLPYDQEPGELDSASVLLITAGVNELNAIMDTSEAFQILKTPQSSLSKWWSMPNSLKSTGVFVDRATTGVLKITTRSDAGNVSSVPETQVPIICGGFDSQSLWSRKCHLLERGDAKAQSRLGGILNFGRVAAASVVLLNGTTLWVTGGFGGDVGDETATTEWIRVSSVMASGEIIDKFFSYGIGLPEPRFAHCLELIHSEIAILFGGSQWGSSGFPVSSRKTWIMNVTDFEKRILTSSSMDGGAHKFWTTTAPMALKRLGHSSGAIRVNDADTVVVAVGGETSDSFITPRVELFRLANDGSGSWEEGPALPSPLTGAASSTNEDRSMLFVTGGVVFYTPGSFSDDVDYEDPDYYYVYDDYSYYFDYVFSQAIYSLSCPKANCAWTQYSMELEQERLYPAAFILNPELLAERTQISTIEEDVTSVKEFCQGNMFNLDDGFCDDNLNNEACDFDGCDCCGKFVDTFFCDICECIECRFLY